MKLTFYFDFLSPYSYLAWCWLRDYMANAPSSLEFSLKPVTMAPLIHAQETKGPAEIPAKREYLMRDILRRTQKEQIPFKAPVQLPFNSLYALRLSLQECASLRQTSVVDAFYRKAWEQGADIGDTEVVHQVLDSLDLPRREWMDKVGSKEARRQLKLNTKEAIAGGVFGVPTFLVENGSETEMFWGSDSIHFLKDYLAGEDPLDKEELKKFQESYKTLE